MNHPSIQAVLKQLVANHFIAEIIPSSCSSDEESYLDCDGRNGRKTILVPRIWRPNPPSVEEVFNFLTKNLTLTKDDVYGGAITCGDGRRRRRRREGGRSRQRRALINHGHMVASFIKKHILQRITVSTHCLPFDW